MKPKQKGFTLIELMVVVAILGILVGIVLIAINPVRILGEARDGKARSDLNQVKAALQLYYNENNVYPNDLSASSTPVAFTTTYMRSMPTGVTYTPSPGGCTTACSDYTANMVLNYPNSDDDSTKTKCSVGGAEDKFYVVCPD